MLKNLRPEQVRRRFFNNEIFLTTKFCVHTTIINARVPDGRTSKRILYSWSPRVQKQMESSSEKFCSVRGSPTTQRIDTPSRVAPRFFVSPFSLITFSTSLFAKAMACDGRMDDSDPSNSSGTKNRHLNYTEIFAP